MYMKRMLEIGQATNGFVIEVRVPIKAGKKSESKSIVQEYPGSCEKQYVAKDATEVVQIITKLMPMLDDTFTSEDQFDAAFEMAATK